MGDPRTRDPMFQKKASRKKIAVGATAVIIVVVVIVVIVVVVVQNNKDDSNVKAPVMQNLDLAKFVSVSSSGLINDRVNVTVRYTGSENCNHVWTYGHMMSNALTFEGGINARIEDRLYETSLLYTDSNLRYLFLRIYCKQYASILELDLNALQQTGFQDNIPDLSNYTFTLTSIDKEPNTNNSRVQLRMNSVVNVTDGSVDINFYFDGLNTSSAPHTVFEEVYFPNGLENSSLRIDQLPLDNGVAQGNIVVASRIAQFGGILTPSTKKIINDGFIRSIEQGISIYLETSETNEVVPSGSFGIFRKPEDSETLKIYKDSHSFNCFVMGNPVPTVEIVLRYQNGSEADFTPIRMLRERYTYHDIVTVEKSQFPDGGTFICRASANGQSQSREETFEFREPQQCAPNSTLTGVIMQTSENDQVRCTATGDPRPELEITLYYYYGPDLLKIDTYQASSAFLDEFTATANLTIAPPNPDVHTVFCVCKQEMFTSSRGPESYQSIVLYPGRPNNETFYSEILEKAYPPL